MKIFLNKRNIFSTFFVFVGVSIFPLQTSANFAFNTNLFYGLSSIEVIELQKILNQDERTRVSDTGPGSPGFETSYFGAKTKNAVMRFQELYRNDILNGAGLASPTGYVGVMTRIKLNSLSDFGTSDTPSLPTPPIVLGQNNLNTKSEISGVVPEAFNDGDQIQINGSAFETQNRITFAFAPDEEILANSTDGKTISVFINTNFGGEIRKTLEEVKSKNSKTVYPIIYKAMQERFSSVGRDGIYITTSLVVKNSKGVSNSIPVTIKVANEYK